MQSNMKKTWNTFQWSWSGVIIILTINAFSAPHNDNNTIHVLLNDSHIFNAWETLVMKLEGEEKKLIQIFFDQLTNNPWSIHSFPLSSFMNWEICDSSKHWFLQWRITDSCDGNAVLHNSWIHWFNLYLIHPSIIYWCLQWKLQSQFIHSKIID